jgi:DNA-binding transcriptional LysR family regulator
MQQSTLSRCIRQLQDSLGVTRSSHRAAAMRGDDRMKTFLRTARSIREQVDALVTSTRYAGYFDTSFCFSAPDLLES